MTETSAPGSGADLNRRSVQKYGWMPDLPDARDLLFTAPEPVLANLPKSVDLRDSFPEPYDQGHLGSCTGNAIAGAFEYSQRQEKQADFVPSRLFIYYNERVIEGTVDTDSGAMIRDGIKSVAKLGVCPEDDWKYDIAAFAERPSASCYTAALNHQVTVYRRVLQVIHQMQGCLASGTPFIFGFSVYESFETPEVAKTGVVPMPPRGERQLGGHAVLAVGYDDATQRFLVRNSWGADWGMGGYFTIPYAYLTDRGLASDFWAIYAVEKAAGV